MKDLKVHVLFRFSKKTGNIDTTMTALGSAMLRMWALQNTTKTKACAIIERESGEVVFATHGTGEFPVVKDCKKERIGHCSDFGISHEAILEIKDDRFDN